MGEVKPLITNTFEGAGNGSLSFDFLGVTPGQTFELCQFPLDFRQMFFALTKQPGIFDLNSVGQISEVLKPHVNPNRVTTMLYRWFNLCLNRKTDKPVETILAKSERFNLTYNRTVQLEAESTKLGEGQAVIFDTPTGLRESETVVTVASFEAGKTWGLPLLTPLKESLESFIQPFKYILQHLGVNCFKVRSNLLDFTQLVSLVVVVERLTTHPVSVPAFLQGSIVQFPATFKRELKSTRLRFGGKYSEFVRLASFHQLLTLLAFDVLFDDL